MLGLLSALACTLYLVPLGAVVALARRESDDALDLACGIGTVFAADLLGTFALCYVFRTERAVFVRTGLLLVVAAVLGARRVRRAEPILARRGALARGDLATLALAGAVGFLASYLLSSAYWMWDREWHVALTGSLRAQQMPFRNVFEPWKPIHYHVVGDLAASSLQALSLVAMNASRALSYAHDLQSLILLAIVAMSLRAVCGFSPGTTTAAALVPLLAGPMMLRVSNQAPGMGAFEGNSDLNNLTLSFRPHCMIALVVLVALLSHVVRLARDRARARPPGAPAIAAMAGLFALLAAADESSTLLVGVSLALVSLRWPRLLGASRWRAAGVLAAFALIAVIANLALAGTLHPGGTVHSARWVWPRLPRYSGPPLPLFNLEGWKQLLGDEGSLLVPMMVMAALLLRRGAGPDDDVLQPPLTLALGVTMGGLLLFLCFEVNGRLYEGHRFMTAARVLVPTAALLCLPRLPRTSFAWLLVPLPVLAGVFVTVGFVFYRLPTKKDARGGEEQYGVNCRTDVGARLGDPIAPTFADRSSYHVFAGCLPFYAPGHDGDPDIVLVGWPMFGAAGFAKMNRVFFPPGQPARVICPTDLAQQTSICQKALKVGTCAAQGTLAVNCSIPAEARASLERP
jgi:hypothetical protein